MNFLVVLLIANAEASLRSRLLLRKVRQPMEPNSVIPGDVDAVQEPVDDTLGAVSDDILGAAGDVSGAVLGVGEQAGNPNAIAGNLLSQAEGTLQDATAGRGLVSDVISRSIGKDERLAVKATTEDGKVVKKVVVTPKVKAIRTTLPADFNGVYCRGAACQYRGTTTSGPPLVMDSEPEPAKTDEASEDELEFCRGLGCPRKRGWPVSGSKTTFELNCLHLFNSYGDHWLVGRALERKAGQVAASYVTACKDRVGMLEASECSRYVDVFLAALAPKMRLVTVGEAVDVCGDAFHFIKSIEQAQIDLELITVPGRHATHEAAGLVNLKQMNAASIGPCSTRGQAWHQWNVRKRERIHPNVAWTTQQASYLQDSTQPPVTEPVPNCSGPIRAQPQSQTMYVLRPGSVDGMLPAVEVDGAEFLHCVSQINEITEEAPLSAAKTVEQLRVWCDWMAAEIKPAWDVQTCVGMTELLAFALRADLRSSNPVSAQHVCKNLYLATGTVNRFEQIMVNAYRLSPRGAPPSGPVPPTLDDAAVREWIDEANRKSELVNQKLHAQHQAEEARDFAKNAVNSWSITDQVIKPSGVFPDSTNFKPGLLAT